MRSIISRKICIFIIRLILVPTRTSCRPCTHQVRYFMHSWAKSCLTGRLPQRWCARLPKIIRCLTIPYRPLIPSVSSMDISAASSTAVLFAAPRLRYTVALPDITGQCRTGMTENVRSLRTARCMISASPY